MPRPMPLPPEFILESLAVGVFTVDADFRIAFFNAEAERLTGFARDKALGRFCFEVFRPVICFTDCVLKRAMETGSPVIRHGVTILDRHNRERPVEVTASALRDSRGRMVGGVESFWDDSARVMLEKQVQASYTFEDLKGASEPMARLYDTLAPLAEADVSLLLLGETGTGKDLTARAVHNAGPRRKRPFVKVNCAALPENLLESELFGFRRGAFTDAKKDKPGRFELADKGTIFLDEIGDMPLPLQAKLLQVLEDREFHPLGSVKTVRVDVRVIASTNRDLEAMVEQGLFRRDLYFRLKVAEITLPPLRERGPDIKLLAEHFLEQAAALNRKRLAGFAPGALRTLLTYPYPGNVRELKNIVDYAALICRGDKVRDADLPEYMRRPGKVCEPKPSPGPGEAGRVLRALEAADWNRDKAAQSLGISRTTLWRRMRRLGIGGPAQ